MHCAELTVELDGVKKTYAYLRQMPPQENAITRN